MGTRRVRNGRCLLLLCVRLCLARNATEVVRIHGTTCKWFAFVGANFHSKKVLLKTTDLVLGGQARARERDSIAARQANEAADEALLRKDADISALKKMVNDLNSQLAAAHLNSVSTVPANDSNGSSANFNIQRSNRNGAEGIFADERPTSMPLVSGGDEQGSLRVIERCMSCGIKGEASVVRATGPHHGRMCPNFVWMVGQASGDVRPQSVLLH